MVSLYLEIIHFPKTHHFVFEHKPVSVAKGYTYFRYTVHKSAIPNGIWLFFLRLRSFNFQTDQKKIFFPLMSIK